MNKDYYSILGIDKKASKDDIKKAFHKIAHKHHPDKAGGDAAKFKEASEAYSVLGDDKKRAEYDTYGRTFAGGGSGGAGGQGGFGGFDFSGFGGAEGFQDFDLGDIFGEFFGGRRGQQQARGRDISIDIELTFKEAAFGTKRSVLLSKTSTCEHCKGSGGEPGSEMITCTTCNGKGQIHETKRSILGSFSTVRTCPECHGKGKVPKVKCKECRGEGVLKKQKEIQINVPAGINNGEMIRMTGEGEAVAGGIPGDLYIKIHVRADNRFRKEGDNLLTELNVKLTDALLGSTYKVPTLEEDLEVVIPAGIAYGETLRVRGKGIPSQQNTSRRGDLLINVKIEIPKKLSRESRKIVEDLKKEGI
jgi:molecular chaperone DnaJ